jgi:hypothetical protein
MKGTVTLDKRLCYACSSNETYIDREGVPRWYFNKGTDLVLCNKCYKHLIGDYNYVRKNRSRFYTYRNKKKQAKSDVRIGVCNWCRAVVPFDTRETHTHHDGNLYDDSNPLRYTIEICESCHPEETFRLRRERLGRECYACGTNKTSIRKIDGTHEWHLNKGTHYVLCNICYHRLIGNRQRLKLLG